MIKMKRLTKIISAFVITVLIFSSFFAVNTFATAGRAYSMGGEFHKGKDVMTAASYFGQCGYVSYYNTELDFAYVNSSVRLNSDIVYFSAHGNQDAIFLPNNIRVSDRYGRITSKTAVISNFAKLSNSKLYIYDACLTASDSDKSGINLCSETYDSGAKCVIGWKTEIGIDDAYKWQKRFQNQLALGKTVVTAANYANGFSDYGSNTIKSWKIYGNKKIIIKKSSSKASALDYNETVKYRDLSTSNIAMNASSAVDTIKNYNSAFNPADYKKEITYTSDTGKDYVIDYSLIHNGFVTNSGYAIIVEDDTAIGLQDNYASIKSDQLNNSILATNLPEAIFDSAKQMAVEQAKEYGDNITIKSQKCEPYFDIATGVYSCHVFTIYELESGGIGAINTYYPLNNTVTK